MTESRNWASRLSVSVSVDVHTSTIAGLYPGVGVRFISKVTNVLKCRVEFYHPLHM